MYTKQTHTCTHTHTHTDTHTHPDAWMLAHAHKKEFKKCKQCFFILGRQKGEETNAKYNSRTVNRTKN